MMTSVTSVRPQVDRDRVLQAATALGLVGSAGADSIARLIAKLCDPDFTAADVAVLVGNHPVLCARVLRVANSAYYGQQRNITTVKQAVLLLGSSAIRGIAAAACVERATPGRGKDDLADIAALMRHSLATAIAAESLARLRRPDLSGEAFIAGVLHNLGVAVQVSIDKPGVMAMLDARKTVPTRQIRVLESQFASVRHEDCVAAVLDAWHLPENLVAATGYHHYPSAAPVEHRDLASLVNLGTTLALATGHTFALEPAPCAERESETAARLKLTAEELEQVKLELPRKVEELHSALFGR
jgi:HD-like signal output (HDOD) protein